MKCLSFSTLEKAQECFKAAKYLKNLLELDLKPKDILTRQSFLNAITIVNILGGSTNAVRFQYYPKYVRFKLSRYCTCLQLLELPIFLLLLMTSKISLTRHRILRTSSTSQESDWYPWALAKRAAGLQVNTIWRMCIK